MKVLNLVTVTGPSGVGKDTVVRKAAEIAPKSFQVAVSHTTRDIRSGERDGEAYHFVTRDKFDSIEASGGFLETVEYSGNFYGVAYSEIASINAHGTIPLLIVEYHGAQIIRDKFDGNLYQVFLSPVGDSVESQIEVLRQRMLSRGDSSASVESRLGLASKELAQSGWFDDVMYNGDSLMYSVGFLTGLVVKRFTGSL